MRVFYIAIFSLMLSFSKFVFSESIIFEQVGDVQAGHNPMNYSIAYDNFVILADGVVTNITTNQHNGNGFDTVTQLDYYIYKYEDFDNGVPIFSGSSTDVVATNVGNTGSYTLTDFNFSVTPFSLDSGEYVIGMRIYTNGNIHATLINSDGWDAMVNGSSYLSNHDLVFRLSNEIGYAPPLDPPLENKEYNIDFSELGYDEVVTDQYSELGLIVSAVEDGSTQYSRLNEGWLSNVGHDILRLTFSSDVSNVSFNFEGWGCDDVEFNAYNSDGEILENLIANCNGVYSFSSSNIAIIEGIQPNDNWWFGINNLAYSTNTEITLPQTTPIEFSITSSAAGYEAFGIDCDISLNSDDNCGTPGDLNNQQAVYVASSTIVGSQKVLTIGYASDQPNLSGIGFELNFDSSKLSLFDVSNVFPGAITVGEVYDDDDNLSLQFGWASIFGQFPGANEVNLVTLTFDIFGYEPPTQLEQIISVNNTPKGVLGRTSVLEVAYDTTDNNNQLSGLGMRVHFDSSLLSFKEITGLIEQDIIVDGQGPFSDDTDFDNDPLTDQYMLFGWASLYNNWPNTELPAVLMNIAFDLSENIDTNVISSTNINFTDTSFTVGYEFSAESYELEILNATWDFDGNGQADALTDGLMMLRHLFGLRGDLVTNDAMAGNSPFDSQQVVAEIEAAMDIVDIDADGELNALTDGLLLLRYLFDLRDDLLTNGVVGPEATRNSNTDIQSYLDSHMPAM